MLLICLGLESEYVYWKEEWNPEAGNRVDLLQLPHEEMGDPSCLAGLEPVIAGEDRVAVLYHCHSDCPELPGWLKGLPEKAVRIPIGSEAVLLDCATVDGRETERLNQYLLYGGEENLHNAGLYLKQRYFGCPAGGEIPAPIELPFDGIIEGETERVYGSLEEYLEAQRVIYPRYVGMLVHRHYWVRRDLEAFWILKKRLEDAGIGTVCVFSNGGSHCKSFEELVDTYFSSHRESDGAENGRLWIRGLVMAQMLPITPKGGLSIARESAAAFEQLGIPVFRPVQSYYLTRSQWEQKVQPLTDDVSSGYVIPEMSGMIEPVLISTRNPETKQTEPLPEQIEWLAERIGSWIKLGEKPNREKRLALMLHNAVCSGVEATIGKAYGLDALESVVQILRCLEAEGYLVEGIPADGKALLALIQEKKAYSDFRWTAVEDIVESGGCLYRMPDTEYAAFYRELPKELQKQLEETWGPYPGEGMVLGRELIVTGLRFGNILVMVQPKRGCYGAKCTGEVCKILHDPLCPPTHQYLASYRYLERIFGADACVDIGTEGSLEFLPGKVNGLSARCWPRVTVGKLPVIYLYHAGVPGEGTVAKRRGHALTVTYLPAAMHGLGQQEKLLLKKAEDYARAVELDNGQEEMLRAELEDMIRRIPAAERIMERAEDFRQGIRELSDAAALMERAGKGSRRHVYGMNPDQEERENYAAEAKEYDAGEICGLLETTGKAELYGLVNALNGRYISPSESGMPDDNGREILPTGRNLYGVKEKDFPGRIPYQRGMALADQLLAKYQEDEGSYPEKAALNMISLDITRTGGEQLSEFLYLMGIRPVWDEKERVKGLEAIGLEELGRPRIDVTVRISGVLRDTWPAAVKLMDEAVLLASSLDEPENSNYVKKHVREYQASYGEGLEREKTIRIFGDPPGGYGAGVDLALKASAWKEEKDLAKYFIQSSAFAYGKELDGEKKIREFAENIKDVQVVSDVIQSKRNDLLSCGFSLNVQGGISLAAKYLGGRRVRRYQGVSEADQEVRTEELGEALENTIKETLLNPFWQETEKQDGYDGAAEMMSRIQHVFEAQCLMECVPDSLLDKLAETYVNNESMREWLTGQNRFAAEEIARRMLELVQREKWKPEEEVLRRLRENYLELEGDMEDGLESRGDIQGGAVEIVSHRELETWQEKLKEVEEWVQ